MAGPVPAIHAFIPFRTPGCAGQARALIWALEIMLLKQAKSGVALPMESAMKILVRAWKRLARTPLKFSRPVASAIGALMVASAAMAQTYPSKLIKVIAVVSSGSPIDVTARLVTTDLSNRFAQPVIVENRPGGGGTIGVGEFAKAMPDGHTLLC